MRRAAHSTAALNARLTPQIRHLIDALSHVLDEESIEAPLMIVKGDGSLMRAEIALEYPVETISVGPCRERRRRGLPDRLGGFRRRRHGRHHYRHRRRFRRPSGHQRRRALSSALGARWSRPSMCAPAVSAATARFTSTGNIGCASVRAKPCRSACWRIPFRPRSRRLRSIAELERLPAYPAHFAFRNPGRALPKHFVGGRAAGVGGVGSGAAAGV